MEVAQPGCTAMLRYAGLGRTSSSSSIYLQECDRRRLFVCREAPIAATAGAVSLHIVQTSRERLKLSLRIRNIQSPTRTVPFKTKNGLSSFERYLALIRRVSFDRKGGLRANLEPMRDAQTTRKPRGNSVVQLPHRVNVSSMAGISIVETTTSSGSSQRSQISIG